MNQANYPGTNTFVTKSYEDRLLDVVEFDDALLDQKIWIDPRYEGCKATGRKINAYTPTHTTIDTNLTSSGEYLGQYVTNDAGDEVWGGDITFGLNPVVQNQTTALYIANTVVGGTEDSQFATIQNHSYVGINQILVINHETDEVQLLDRNVEGYEEFHRFITNDLPTGASFSMTVLDKGISSNLKGNYKVKMNKGWLINSFDFNFISSNGACSLSTNNAMYLYTLGTSSYNNYITGSQNLAGGDISIQGEETRFRYALINMHESSVDDTGPLFEKAYIGPSFASSSIINNKFTRQFYSGSFGFIKDSFSGDYNHERIGNSGMGSASRFLGINCLDFLKANNEDVTLEENEKTEMHITFFEGTKDFAPGYNDERSISTFEVDQNQNSLDIGDHCNDFLPTSHEIIFKGKNDHRFTPIINTYSDKITNVYLANSSSIQFNYTDGAYIVSKSAGYANLGCTHKNTVPGQHTAGNFNFYQPGINQDIVNTMQVYVQGGNVGTYGYQLDISSSTLSYTASNDPTRIPYTGQASSDNAYSGSFNYQVSFLDKDHTIIADIDKDAELFDGIGRKGLVLIPETTHYEVSSNIDFYLKKAGLITEAPIKKIPTSKFAHPFITKKPQTKHKRKGK